MSLHSLVLIVSVNGPLLTLPTRKPKCQAFEHGPSLWIIRGFSSHIIRIHTDYCDFDPHQSKSFLSLSSRLLPSATVRFPFAELSVYNASLGAGGSPSFTDERWSDISLGTVTPSSVGILCSPLLSKILSLLDQSSHQYYTQPWGVCSNISGFQLVK